MHLPSVNVVSVTSIGVKVLASGVETWMRIYHIQKSNEREKVKGFDLTHPRL